MRIGFITGEYPPMQGGVGDYTRQLARALLAAGHSVAVFSDARAATQEPDIPVTGVSSAWTPATFRAVRRWAEAARLDVINLQYQTAAYGMSPWIHAAPELARPFPLVTCFHDLRPPYLFPKAGRVREWAVTRLARASRGAIVTNSEDHARLAALPRLALIPIGSNITTPLPADFDAAAWRARAGASRGDFLLACFGLRNRSKGIDTLLHSLAALRTRGVPARLVLVGGRVGASDATNAAYAAELDALIARLGLAPFVCDSGWVDDESAAAFLSAADVVALPYTDGASYRRGTLMAALHYGCAVVTTTPRVPTPAFVDGVNMALVPPGDADALTARLATLHAAPQERETLRAGATQLRKQFLWPGIARDLITFFGQILA